MTAPFYDIESFLKRVADYDFQYLLDAAVDEGTRAERASFGRGSSSQRAQGSLLYAEILKGLVFFLRYGQKPHGLNDGMFQLFRPLCERLVQKGQLRPAILQVFDGTQDRSA